ARSGERGQDCAATRYQGDEGSVGGLREHSSPPPEDHSALLEIGDDGVLEAACPRHVRLPIDDPAEHRQRGPGLTRLPENLAQAGADGEVVRRTADRGTEFLDGARASTLFDG